MTLYLTLLLCGSLKYINAYLVHVGRRRYFLHSLSSISHGIYLSITDYGNSVTWPIVFRDHLNPMTLFMLLGSQVFIIVQNLKFDSHTLFKFASLLPLNVAVIIMF